MSSLFQWNSVPPPTSAPAVTMTPPPPHGLRGRCRPAAMGPELSSWGPPFHCHLKVQTVRKHILRLHQMSHCHVPKVLHKKNLVPDSWAQCLTNIDNHICIGKCQFKYLKLYLPFTSPWIHQTKVKPYILYLCVSKAFNYIYLYFCLKLNIKNYILALIGRSFLYFSLYIFLIV